MGNNRDLRLLVTKACNYKCTFCHEEGLPEVVSNDLTIEDYVYLYKIANRDLNFKSVTLTGGEPLLRDDVIQLTKLLYENGCKVTLTTNGYLLGEKSEIGKYLEKVNISLHALDEKKYEAIVQKKSSFKKFQESVKKFRENNPEIRIVFNITIVKGMNDSISDLLNIINYAKELNTEIKIIELFPNTDPGCVTLDELTLTLNNFNFKVVKSNHRTRTLSDDVTSITLTKIFCEIQRDNKNSDMCGEYNDLFISPNGSIKPCRNKDYVVSIKEDIKGKNDIQLSEKLSYTIEVLGKNCDMKKDILLFA